MKNRFLAIVVVGGVMLMMGVGLFFAVLFVELHSRTPNWERRVRHAQIQEKVQLVRDEACVPHIRAQHGTDAYFAMGYAMGQDRLFQMELLRRLADGRLAEIFGEAFASVDQLVRAMQLRAWALHALEELEEDDGMRRALDAFILGINTAQTEEPQPFEFWISRVPSRPFTATDSLMAYAFFQFAFSEELREELLFSVLQARLAQHELLPLFSSKPESQHADFRTATLQGDELIKITALLSLLSELTKQVGTMPGDIVAVLGGEYTDSGKPALLGAPTWGNYRFFAAYEAQLSYDDVQTYGWWLPLFPFPLSGVTRHHAWMLTRLKVDDVDFYHETFARASSGESKLTEPETVVATHEESIRVRAAKDLHYTLRVTQHGPVLTDALDASYSGPNTGLALSWRGAETTFRDLTALYRMSRATNYDAFESAVGAMGSVTAGISYADTDGRIAFWTSVKSEGGSKEEFSQNCLVLGNTADAEGLENRPTEQRMQRLAALLEKRPSWDKETLQTLLLDVYAEEVVELRGQIQDILRHEGGALRPLEIAAYLRMAKWDRCMDKNAPGAAIYAVLCDTILRQAIQDELGEDLFAVYKTISSHSSFLQYLMASPDSPWWDDVSTPQRESMRDIVVHAFKDTVACLKTRFGGTIDHWQWGKLHNLPKSHRLAALPIIGNALFLSVFPTSGALHTVNSLPHTGGPCYYETLYGPAFRCSVDWADGVYAHVALPAKENGTLREEGFFDGEYRAAHFSFEQVQSHTNKAMIFEGLK